MTDYEQGVADCKAGIPHADKSPEYTQGYSDQYTKEQHESEHTK